MFIFLSLFRLCFCLILFYCLCCRWCFVCFVDCSFLFFYCFVSFFLFYCMFLFFNCWFLFLYCCDLLLLDFCGFCFCRFMLLYILFCLFLCIRLCFVLCCWFFGLCFSFMCFCYTFLLLERECFDLFGFIFCGNDCLHRLFVDWFFVGFFLLKCYPLFGLFVLLFCLLMEEIICTFTMIFLLLHTNFYLHFLF
nr:NADH dehydrogenase subunit 9 [Trypanosoma cruzi]